MERDRLGRRRSPEQERGLRPLYPALPEEWISKVLRVAMSGIGLGAVRGSGGGRYAPMAPTQARACGLVLSSLLHSERQPDPGPLNWMDWERQQDAATAADSRLVRRSDRVGLRSALDPHGEPRSMVSIRPALERARADGGCRRGWSFSFFEECLNWQPRLLLPPPRGT